MALNERDRGFHRVKWGDIVTDEFRELRMTRLRCDDVSSSFHSTPAFQDCGKNCEFNPNTVNVVHNVFWVDNLLSGAS